MNNDTPQPFPVKLPEKAFEGDIHVDNETDREFIYLNGFWWPMDEDHPKLQESDKVIYEEKPPDDIPFEQPLGDALVAGKFDPAKANSNILETLKNSILGDSVSTFAKEAGFPENPVQGQMVKVEGGTYIWDGSQWYFADTDKLSFPHGNKLENLDILKKPEPPIGIPMHDKSVPLTKKLVETPSLLSEISKSPLKMVDNGAISYNLKEQKVPVSASKVEFDVAKDPAKMTYEVTGHQQFVIDGVPKVFEYTLHAGKEAIEDGGGAVQDIKAEISKQLMAQAQIHINQSANSMVGQALGGGMQIQNDWGGKAPEALVVALIEQMKFEVGTKIENESDIDIEKQLEEVGGFLLACLLKHCKKVAVDKDLAHMKYRVMLDMHFEIGELEKWLSL